MTLKTGFLTKEKIRNLTEEELAELINHLNSSNSISTQMNAWHKAGFAFLVLAKLQFLVTSVMALASHHYVWHSFFMYALFVVAAIGSALIGRE